MTNVDRSLIANFSLFSGLTGEQLDLILRDARAVRHPKNAVVFAQGDEVQSFFVLLHGHLRVIKTTPDGQQVVVRYVVPGEVFGIGMALGLTAYPATALAVEDSVMLAWPARLWPELVAQFPSLATHALQAVGSRLQDAHTRVVEMSTEQVERRVAHALLRLAKQAGRKIDGGVQIAFPISRQDIAEMTGTTLHTVSRVLSSWEQQGLVESGRQRIVIRDPHRLFERAESPPD